MILLRAFILICMVCAMAFNSCMAQSKELVVSDSLAKEKEEGLEIMLGAEYQMAQFVSTNASFAGLQVGMLLPAGWQIELSYQTILDNFKKKIIFPTDHRYKQETFGMGIKYLFLARKIRPFAGANVKYAYASWYPDTETSGETFSDHLVLYELNAGAYYVFNKWMKLRMYGGYGLAGDLDLVGLEKADFNGFNFGIGIYMTIFKS